MSRKSEKNKKIKDFLIEVNANLVASIKDIDKNEKFEHILNDRKDPDKIKVTIPKAEKKEFPKILKELKSYLNKDYEFSNFVFFKKFRSNNLANKLEKIYKFFKLIFTNFPPNLLESELGLTYDQITNIIKGILSIYKTLNDKSPGLLKFVIEKSALEFNKETSLYVQFSNSYVRLAEDYSSNYPNFRNLKKEISEYRKMLDDKESDKKKEDENNNKTLEAIFKNINEVKANLFKKFKATTLEYNFYSRHCIVFFELFFNISEFRNEKEKSGLNNTILEALSNMNKIDALLKKFSTVKYTLLNTQGAKVSDKADDEEKDFFKKIDSFKERFSKVLFFFDNLKQVFFASERVFSGKVINIEEFKLIIREIINHTHDSVTKSAVNIAPNIIKLNDDAKEIKKILFSMKEKKSDETLESMKFSISLNEEENIKNLKIAYGELQKLVLALNEIYRLIKDFKVKRTWGAVIYIFWLSNRRTIKKFVTIGNIAIGCLTKAFALL